MMGSLMAELEAREAAARGRAEALRERIAELTQQLASEEELLERLGITRQTVVEILVGDHGCWAPGATDGRVGGADAVLKHRPLKTNSDSNRYWQFHLARENHRIHTPHYQDTYHLAA